MSADLPDPEDVHPEHDVLTPANEGDWTDEQKEAYRAAKEAQLDAEARETRREIDEGAEKAVEALLATDEDRRVEVAINEDTTIDVKPYLNERMESLFDEIAGADTADEVAEQMIEAITWLVDDDDYANPEVWRAFRRERGISGLQLMFGQITEPVLRTIEGRGELGNSHGAAEDS